MAVWKLETCFLTVIAIFYKNIFWKPYVHYMWVPVHYSHMWALTKQFLQCKSTEMLKSGCPKADRLDLLKIQRGKEYISTTLETFGIEIERWIRDNSRISAFISRYF